MSLPRKINKATHHTVRQRRIDKVLDSRPQQISFARNRAKRCGLERGRASAFLHAGSESAKFARQNKRSPGFAWFAAERPCGQEAFG